MSLATPENVWDFVQAIHPDLVQISDIEDLFAYYLAKDLMLDRLAFGVMVERMLRP
jgi:hypothetical protein